MSKLAVIFPGIGYTCDKPLLYYAQDLAVQNGYECIKIMYAQPGETRIKGNLEKMEEAFRILYARAQECLSEIDWKQYEEIVFISKSIGTVIASAYARELQGIAVRHVLYTPLEHTFQFQPQNAIGFIGTADSWSVPAEVIKLAAQQSIPMHVYDNANHSLEKGDVMANLYVLKDVMKETGTFLQKERGTQDKQEYYVRERSRSVVFVVRNGKILMERVEYFGRMFYTLPGGGIEAGETPEQAAIRELKEECGLDGKIVRPLMTMHKEKGGAEYSFEVEIPDDQEPITGYDPEESSDNPPLKEVLWMSLNEISEKDRAFLWAYGLMQIKGFFDMIKEWGDEISYPIGKPKPRYLYHGSQYRFDVVKPQQAYGANQAESQAGIYAATTKEDVIPFALPFRFYPDEPGGRLERDTRGMNSFLKYGSIDPNGKGYIYVLPSETFEAVDMWQWISRVEVKPVEVIEIQVKDYLQTIQLSEEAKEIQRKLYGETGLFE